MAYFGQIFYYFLTYLVAEIQNKHYICNIQRNFAKCKLFNFKMLKILK